MPLINLPTLQDPSVNEWESEGEEEREADRSDKIADFSLGPVFREEMKRPLETYRVLLFPSNLTHLCSTSWQQSSHILIISFQPYSATLKP